MWVARFLFPIHIIRQLQITPSTLLGSFFSIKSHFFIDSRTFTTKL